MYYPNTCVYSRNSDGYSWNGIDYPDKITFDKTKVLFIEQINRTHFNSTKKGAPNQSLVFRFEDKRTRNYRVRTSDERK